MAIAAAAQAAAAAAGLPDPAAVDDEPLSPMRIDEPVDGAPPLTAAAGDEEAAAAAIGESGSPATAAMAAAVAALKPTGSSGVEAGVLHQVMSALQRQMQKLVTLEERRSVDIVRLNAKVGEHRVKVSQPSCRQIVVITAAINTFDRCSAAFEPPCKLCLLPAGVAPAERARRLAARERGCRGPA